MSNCIDANGVATLQCIPDILKEVIYIAYAFGGAIAVIIIVMSGIRFIFSGGDAKKVSTSKRSLTFAIMGLAIIILSYFVLNLIAYFTGATCISSWPPGFTNCT